MDNTIKGGVVMRKEDTWWCCGVERSVEDRCSCGDKYEEPLYPNKRVQG